MDIKPIEYDVGMDRLYIPVNSRYEIQTKGKGSSFRIANTVTHERHLVSCAYVQAMLEDMAKVTHAELMQQQAEITSLRAELKANNDKVILALASIRDIFEYDDEMVRSGAISFTEDVAGFVKTKVAVLQAREKVLVEALQNLVEDISKTHGNYTYEQAWINADEALANVRCEL